MIPGQRTSRGTVLSLALIAILVVLARGVVFLIDPSADGYQGEHPDRWLETARNVVNGKGYSLSTFGLSDEPRPTAVRGPTGVYFFAAILSLFGDNNWSIVIAQWLVDVGTALILFFIALEIFQDRKVAFITSVLFAFYVPGIIFTLHAWSEPVFTLILAGFSLSLLFALRQSSALGYALAGALLGLAALARPIMQFYPLAILPLMWWALDRSRAHVIPKFAVFSLAFAAVLSPWVIRNYRVFNTFIPGSNWSGPPFYEGNFALDQPDYLRQRSSGDSGVALRKVLEARFGSVNVPDNGSYYNAIGLDELEINQIAFHEGLKVVGAHPVRYISLSVVRFFRLWLHHRFVNFVIMGGKLPKVWPVAVVNGALLGLAAAAFIWFRGNWIRPAIFLVALIAYTSALYAATNAVARYSVPIIPYVMLFAAFTLVQLLKKQVKAEA